MLVKNLNFERRNFDEISFMKVSHLNPLCIIQQICLDLEREWKDLDLFY